MTPRRVLLTLSSIGLSIFLIAVLIRIGNINFGLLLLQLEDVSSMDFAKLVLLNGLLVFLSTAKWRSVDVVLCRSSDSIPTRIASYTVTGVGMALGLILPVQVSMSAARTLGTYAHGRPFKRGTAGTLFEQSFDVLIAFFLLFASGITWFYRGGALMWLSSAVVMTLLALLAAAPLIRLIQRLGAYVSVRTGAQTGQILRAFLELHHSNLLDSRLARRLLAISAIRFVVLVLIAGQTAHAIHADISLWRIAAAAPLVVVASAIVVTPSALGISEVTFATALHLFGTPLNVASQWVLSHRVLGTASLLIVAACAITLLGIEKATAPSHMMRPKNLSRRKFEINADR